MPAAIGSSGSPAVGLVPQFVYLHRRACHDALTWFDTLYHTRVPLLIPRAYRDSASLEAVTSCVHVYEVRIGFKDERIQRHDNAQAGRHHNLHLCQHLGLELMAWIRDSA